MIRRLPKWLPRGGERAGASCRTAVPQGGAAAGSKPVTRTKKSADAVDGFFIQAAEGGLVCNLAAGEYGITAPAVYGITAQSAVYVYLGGLMTYSSDELMTYRLRRIPYNGFAVDEVYYTVRHNITAAKGGNITLGLIPSVDHTQRASAIYHFPRFMDPNQKTQTALYGTVCIFIF